MSDDYPEDQTNKDVAKDQETPKPPQEKGKKRRLTDTEPICVPSTSRGPSPAPDLPLWVAGGSPARFVAPDELLKMSVAMDNLALVHEIAIDPNYKVGSAVKNPIEVAIRENMLRAYWDLLTDDLNKDPPSYEHAFNLLLEIKQIIVSELLTTRHIRLKDEINSILDENTLRNKLEQGCLDVKAVAQFVLEVLGRMCAPERDQIIEQIRSQDGIVEIIKGIFNLLDVMKDDMANFVISQNRTAVENHSCELEYKTFQKYLDHVPEGSKITKHWLRQAYDEVCPDTLLGEPGAKREKPDAKDDEELVKTTSRGYLKLVQSEAPTYFPETLRIDRGRFLGLAEKFLQLTITTSAVFVTCNWAGKEVSEREDFKGELKNRLLVITNDIEEKNLEETLKAVVEQCVKDVADACDHLGVAFPEERAEQLRLQLAALTNTTNAVRVLVLSRLSKFVEQMLCSPNEVPHRLLPGLSVVERELCAFTARLLRLCVHNRKTFMELYHKLLHEIRLSRQSDGQTPSTSSD